MELGIFNKRTKGDDFKVSDRKGTVIDERTEFTIVEAYKIVRTNIMFSLGNGTGCKPIVFSSANPGEGKTTSCLNLAITFAQMGAKVLIIDGDLRCPRVHEYLNLPNEIGLSNVLSGFSKLENAVVSVEEYNFDCITSGHIPPNPAELLATESMSKIIDSLSDKYDYIFIDSPPINVVTDAIIISTKCYGVVLISRQNYTTYDSLDKVLSTLNFSNTKVLGIILNDTEPKRKHSYRYRYSRYGYGYENSDRKVSENKQLEDNNEK